MAENSEVLTTTNVYESLQNYANTSHIPIEKVDFDIIAFASYFRTSPKSKWQRIDTQAKKKILSVKYLTNERLALTEQYKIRLYPKLSTTKCKPLLTLYSSKSHAQIEVSIKKESNIALTKACMQTIKDELAKKLVLSGYMLGLFAHIDKTVKQLIQQLQKEPQPTKDIRLLLSRAVEPEVSSVEKIIEHYLKKSETRTGKLEDGVDPGALLIEYQFPFFGKGGRDCRGKFLDSTSKIPKANTLFYFDDSVVRKIEENSILFYAKKQGFVQFNDNTLIVSNQLNLDVASLKATGHITPGKHRDVDIKINEKDTTKDAIEQGVDIHVTSLQVEGSIGSNTKIKAQSVEIGEQTHKNSTIQVNEDAKIHLHRGNIKAKNAEIEKFEHGTIEAENVKVTQLLGGKIFAKNVEIGELHSNAKIYFSDTLSINTIKGGHNAFIVAPARIADYVDRVEQLQEALNKTKNEHKAKVKEYEAKKKRFEVNFSRISEFQQQAAIAVKASENIPKPVIIKLKQYKNDRLELEKDEKEIETLYDQFLAASSDYDHIQAMYKHASITYSGIWDGESEIIFEHTDSEMIERYIPHGRENEIVYSKLDEDLLQVVKEK